MVNFIRFPDVLRIFCILAIVSLVVLRRGWVRGRPSDLQKTCADYPQGLIFS